METRELGMRLVTGASGRLGGRVVELLRRTGAFPIVAAARDPRKLAHLRGAGITVRRADFDDGSTLTDAFRGAAVALFVSADAPKLEGERLARHRTAIRA